MEGIVVYGPQGCGKSANAGLLAKHFGKTRIVEGDDWQPGEPLPGDTLVTTNRPPELLKGYRTVEFFSAMQAIKRQALRIRRA